jgi:hypothetical protein
MFVIRVSMAPFTYIGYALSAALGSCIHFGSLEFINIDGPLPVSGFHPIQAHRLSGLDFVADHLGQWHPSASIIPPQQMQMPASILYPNPVPCLGDLDSMADHLGQLHLGESTIASATDAALGPCASGQ